MTQSESESECKKLYENCTYIGGIEFDVYAYTPKNELDEAFFKLLTNNELLQHPNIEIKKEMNCCEFYCEQYAVGCVRIFDETQPTCNGCNLTLPVDLEYYTTNELNLCYLCHNEKNTNTNMKIAKIDSNLDNVNDWVCIFRYNGSYPEYGYKMKYFNEFYCNLNTNSKYYKQFARTYYVEMLGEVFHKIEETSIDSIINKYCK